MREAAKKAAGLIAEGFGVPSAPIARIIDSAITESQGDAGRLVDAMLDYLKQPDGNRAALIILDGLARKVEGGK